MRKVAMHAQQNQQCTLLRFIATALQAGWLAAALVWLVGCLEGCLMEWLVGGAPTPMVVSGNGDLSHLPALLLLLIRYHLLTTINIINIITATINIINFTILLLLLVNGRCEPCYIYQHAAFRIQKVNWLQTASL